MDGRKWLANKSRWKGKSKWEKVKENWAGSGRILGGDVDGGQGNPLGFSVSQQVLLGGKAGVGILSPPERKGGIVWERKSGKLRSWDVYSGGHEKRNLVT